MRGYGLLLQGGERDAALRGLGQLDAGRGVPILVRALQDDRARVAIYGLRAALLAMPTGRPVAVLRDVPTDKVTVAKEVARLLGDVGSHGAWVEVLVADDMRRTDDELRAELPLAEVS